MTNQISRKHDSILNSFGRPDDAALGRLAELLFPMMRSICGPGLRASIGVMSDFMPMSVHEIPSGTKVFDWTVPHEWIFRAATVRDSLGNVILDAEKHNLHVLNFSEPIDRSVSGAELKEHLFFDPNRPDSIPYRTSYYAPAWGFCCDRDFFDAIDDSASYAVKIDAEKLPGSLTVGDARLNGETSKEIVFSSYLCHPQLAVNELSGPLTLACLYQLLAAKNARRFTYRFVLSSETIGALTALSLDLEHYQEKMIGGAAIQMTGLAFPIVHRQSREETTFDRAISNAIRSRSLALEPSVPWSPIGGGDQRQWTARGIDLPMSYFSRTLGGNYPEYHTSDDNLGILDISKVIESAEVLSSACEILENDRTYLYCGPPGEPFLSSYGLVSTTGGPKANKYHECLKALIGCSDGSQSLLDIGEQFDLPHATLVEAADKLLVAGLLEQAG